jgi:hypothetical protein
VARFDPAACDNSLGQGWSRLTTSPLLPVAQQDAPTIGPYHATARRFFMMTKTKLALAALALLQIVPAAEAASKKHHEAGAHSAYAYAPRDEFSPSNYYYAKEAYGWDAGLYPFNFASDGHRVPLRSNGLCWVPSIWGNPEWGPCS